MKEEAGLALKLYVFQRRFQMNSHKKICCSLRKAIDCIVITRNGMQSLPQTIQPTTSPPQSRAKALHVSQQQWNHGPGTKEPQTGIHNTNGTAAVKPASGTGDLTGADDLTVSLGKTVDCIVSSEGEYGSTTIQSTTSASRTASA